VAEHHSGAETGIPRRSQVEHHDWCPRLGRRLATTRFEESETSIEGACGRGGRPAMPEVGQHAAKRGACTRRRPTGGRAVGFRVARDVGQRGVTTAICRAWHSRWRASTAEG